MLSMWFPAKDDRSRKQGREPFSPSHMFRIEDEWQEGDESGESGVLKKMGWVSAALGAVALGLIVGRELRQRYKFNRRTPYDHYSHSGDSMSELSDVEFGVGI